MASEWLRTKNITEERRKNKKGYGVDATYRGRVAAVSGDSETINLEHVGGSDTVPITHPFMSKNSWIRSIPDSDTTALITNRADVKEPVILSYFDSNQATRIEEFKKKARLYRPLAPGEHEIGSSGGAQTYFGRLPHLEDNVGICSRWLSQILTESGAKSPVHTRVMHNHVVGTIHDEERLGVVKRFLPGSSIREQWIRWATPPGFAKEYLRIIGTNIPSPAPLDRYEDLRIGCVVEDTGIPGISTHTGGLMRFRHRLFTNTGEYLEVSVDELGNASVISPTTAVVGTKVNIPMGGLELLIGAPGFRTTVAGPYQLTSTASVEIMSPLVSIGSAKNEQAVLGTTLLAILTKLMTALLSHQHIGNLGVLTLPDPASIAQLTPIQTEITTPAGGKMPDWLSEFIQLSKVS